MSWRPESAWPVVLSDSELAKLGMLAVLESQGHGTIVLCLKSLQKLSTTDTYGLQKRQTSQLLVELAKQAARADGELAGLVVNLADAWKLASDARHPFIHAFWGQDAEGVDRLAYDPRRDRVYRPHDLDDAVHVLASFGRIGKQCVIRVAELILDGLLDEGSLDSPFGIRWRGRLVHF